MSRQVRTYDKWLQGVTAAGDPAAGDFNTENAQVYENGTLGPRPGWKAISDTAGTRVWDISDGDTLQGLQWYLETDDNPGLALLFRDDSAAAHKYDLLPLDTATWVAGATLSDLGSGGANLFPPRYDDQNLTMSWNDGQVLTALGPHILSAGASSPGTVAAITTADGDARVVTLYRERAYYWGINGKPGRIYYSDAADYATVGALSFFPVNADDDSWAGAPVGAWSVKNALLIATKDNRWMVLTGTSPENGTLRELGTDPVPFHGGGALVDNQLYFLSPTGLGVVVATPSFVDSTSLGYLSPLAYPGSTVVRPNNNFQPLPAVGDDVNGSLFLPGRLNGDDPDIVAVERVNDVFALSRWAFSTGPADVRFTKGRPNELYAAASTATDIDLFSRNHTLNRPAKSNDTKSVALGSEAATASGSSVIVDLGEQTAGEGKIVRPVKVVLDIDYWKGGNYSAPELAIDATVLGTEATTPEDAMTQQTVTVTGWADSVGNAPYKRRVSVALPHLQFGTRFKIRLTYDNLALDSVQVYYDEQDDPR